VTTSDFEEMLEFLGGQPDPNIKEVVQVWKSHLESQQWTVTPHPVWNRFEPFWDLPNELLDDFRNSDLVFIKGMLLLEYTQTAQAMQTTEGFTEI
jgi:hypothetical protein